MEVPGLRGPFNNTKMWPDLYNIIMCIHMYIETKVDRCLFELLRRVAQDVDFHPPRAPGVTWEEFRGSQHFKTAKHQLNHFWNKDKIYSKFHVTCINSTVL